MPKPFYDGARDAFFERGVPKTPCRNIDFRPCVLLSHDDSQMFPRRECLPHYCTRHTDHYEEGQIPHQWAIEEVSVRGAVLTVAKDEDFGDSIHGGPYCTRCQHSFCRWCNPNIWTEPCENQDPVLPTGGS